MAFSLDTLHSFAREGGLQTLLVAAAILIVTAIVSHMVAKGLRRLLMRDEVALPSSSIFVNIARATLWVLGLCVALSTCFGIDVSAAVAALGVGGIALSLGFKDTASNLIGGLQVSLMGLVVPGDNIRVGTSSGGVEDVSWRQTVVRPVDGQQIIIPNSIIKTAALEKLPPATTVKIAVSIATDGSALDETAREMERRAAAAVERVSVLTEAPRVTFSEIAEGSFKCALTFAVADAVQVSVARDAVVRAIAPLARGGAFVTDDAANRTAGSAEPSFAAAPDPVSPSSAKPGPLE